MPTTIPPPLPDGCNSWIAIRRETNEVIGEFWHWRNVARFNSDTVEVLPTVEYLRRVNRTIREVNHATDY